MGADMTNRLIEKIKESQEKKHADNLMKIGMVLSEVLDHLAPMFKPQTRLTFLARTPGRPDQDVCVGNDVAFEDLVKMVVRCQQRAGQAQLLPTRPAGLAKRIEEITMEETTPAEPCCTTAQPIATDCGPALDCNGMPIPGSTDPDCCIDAKLVPAPCATESCDAEPCCDTDKTDCCDKDAA